MLLVLESAWCVQWKRVWKAPAEILTSTAFPVQVQAQLLKNAIGSLVKGTALAAVAGVVPAGGYTAAVNAVTTAAAATHHAHLHTALFVPLAKYTCSYHSLPFFLRLQAGNTVKHAATTESRISMWN